MTDFLSRLIDRSTGRAAVAHPVAAPLFATGPSLAMGPDLDAEVDAGSGPARRDPASRPSESPTSKSPEEDPVALATPSMKASHVPPSFESTPVPAVVNRPVPPVPPVVSRPVPGDRREPIREGRLAAGLRSPDRLLASPFDLLASQVRIEGGVASPEGETDERGHMETGEATVFGRLPAPEPPRFLQASTFAPPPTREPPAAPIIRVSIGRIDVRAVSPAAPTVPVPAPTRKDDRLSLEEYLKPPERRR